MLVALAGIISVLTPLADADLPQHLGDGEWILRHRRVPTVEPFSWTRIGDPYFAHSWLAALLYYLTLKGFGALGLHLLNQLIATGVICAALVLGRVRGWSSPARIAVAGLGYLAMLSISPALRPKQLLYVLVPLVWVVTDALQLRAGRSRFALLALLGSAAANSHIFFPITAVPPALALATAPPERRRRFALALGAVVLGWFVSPHAWHWPGVFKLYFGDSIFLERPTAIEDFLPGFETGWTSPGIVGVVAALLAAPWLVADRYTSRERAVHGLVWAAGLGAFGYAVRMLDVWWLISLPLVGDGLARAFARVRPADSSRATWLTTALVAVLLAAAMPRYPFWLWRLEGTTTTRTLPTTAATPAWPLASWLACNTDPQAGGRVFTTFGWGSYLHWRLPRYSMSVDGRTIFPDSVGVEFTMRLFAQERRHPQTWTWADVAILPRWYSLAFSLDAHPDWVPLADSDMEAGLWARRDWWKRWGSRPPSWPPELVTTESPTCGR